MVCLRWNATKFEGRLISAEARTRQGEKDRLMSKSLRNRLDAVQRRLAASASHAIRVQIVEDPNFYGNAERLGVTGSDASPRILQDSD